MASPVLVPPELSQGESYHVFCSFSNTDQQWTDDLIQQLEDRGLTVCDPEDTPGRNILENMSESIQQSQKVLLVLSAEFLRSRWCLLEANMSLFRDCLQRKPIVPVLLQRDVPIPLHLSHLPFLDVQTPDFMEQLLRALCTPNQELEDSTVVPYRSPSLYYGKNLEPLFAVNEDQLINKFNCGLWSNVVPDQLSLIIQRADRYREAMGVINTVAQTKVRFRSYGKLFLAALVIGLLIVSIAALIQFLIKLPHGTNVQHAFKIVGIIILAAIELFALYKIFLFRKNEKQRILRELQKVVGQANSLLFEENILMGAESKSKLLLVYVSVDSCRQQLSALSQDHELAMLKYSCGYTCCLAKRYFPFQPPSNTGHLKDTVCFCQFAVYQLSLKETKRFSWWRKP